MPLSADDLVHVRLMHALNAAPDLRWLSFSDGTSHTNSAFIQYVQRFSAGLQERGIVKGDRLVMMVGNRLEFLVCWLAAQAIGAIVVPINTAVRGPVLKHQCDLVQCKAAVIESEWLPRLEDSIGSSPYLKTLITIDNETPDRVPPAWRASKRVELFEDVYSDLPPKPVEMHPSDPASIMYTSATTGPSKGVIWCHKSTLHMVEAWSSRMALGPSDTVYACLPLFHTNALITAVIPALLAGGRAYIAPRFSASNFWQDIYRSEATVTNLLGAMVSFLFQQKPSDLERSHRVRTMFVCPTNADSNRLFRERFNVEVVSAFGLTDLGIIIYQQSGMPSKSGSSGVPLPQWEVKLVDDYDEEVPRGSLGMCVVRPREPWIMSLGYWGNPEATAASYRNLWFHTGDVLRQDEDGEYYYVDRQKDMIRRRGENISALEVERAVVQHPSVLECAAYALPSEFADDEVAVAVVLRPGAELTEETLVRSIENQLPYFAVPRFVTILDQLPKTQTEKVQKARLREQGITPDMWDRERTGYKVSR